MKVKRKYIFPIIWLSLITYASLTSGSSLPKELFFKNLDKLIHFCMYFGLAFLMIPAIKIKKKYFTYYAITFIVSSILGIFFEYLQEVITANRTASAYDAIANSAGAFAGVIIYQIFIREKRIEKIIFKTE